MNLNKLAKQITLKEGKKLSLNIAQVKEVLRLVLLALKEARLKDVIELLKRSK